MSTTIICCSLVSVQSRNTYVVLVQLTEQQQRQQTKEGIDIRLLLDDCQPKKLLCESAKNVKIASVEQLLALTCGYFKCLTVGEIRLMARLVNQLAPSIAGDNEDASDLEQFVSALKAHRMAKVYEAGQGHDKSMGDHPPIYVDIDWLEEREEFIKKWINSKPKFKGLDFNSLFDRDRQETINFLQRELKRRNIAFCKNCLVCKMTANSSKEPGTDAAAPTGGSEAQVDTIYQKCQVCKKVSTDTFSAWTSYYVMRSPFL